MVKAGMVVLYKDPSKREIERLGVVRVSYTVQSSLNKEEEGKVLYEVLNPGTDRIPDVIEESDIIKKGTERTHYKKIPFTSCKLNAMTYGGVARGKILEICGRENGGKTSLSLDLCGNAQKIFQEEYEDKLREYRAEYDVLVNGGKSKEKQAAKLLVEMEEFEENGPKVVVYFDLENTLDEIWAQTLGVDTSSLILVRPQSQTGEQVLQMALDLIDSGGVGLLVIDSLPLLVPQQIFDDSLEKKSMGGIAKLLSDFCNRVTPKLTVNDCTLIGLNQVRENVSGYGAPEITPGGRFSA